MGNWAQRHLAGGLDARILRLLCLKVLVRTDLRTLLTRLRLMTGSALGSLRPADTDPEGAELPSRDARTASGRVDLRTFLELQRQFKRFAIQSLAHRRLLEKDLAVLKHPTLQRTELGVTADLFEWGGVLTDSATSVSVVITNFNYSEYLATAVMSVLAQSHRPTELIVVDDASTDNSLEVLRGALPLAPPIPVRCLALKHNVGLPAARNAGILLARGQFVFILDADNHLLKDCLRIHVSAADKEGSDAAYGLVRTFGTTSHVICNAPFGVDRLASGPYIDAMAIFRRSALIDSGLYSTELVLHGWEDYELWLRFASQGRRVAFIPSILSHYRSHRESMVRLTAMDTTETWLQLFNRYPEIFAKVSATSYEAEALRRSRVIAVDSMGTEAASAGSMVPCNCSAPRLRAD